MSVPKPLSRMTARSVVLCVLLGAHPGVGERGANYIRLTADFGIRETGACGWR